jgi:hypothetical protein
MISSFSSRAVLPTALESAISEARTEISAKLSAFGAPEYSTFTGSIHPFKTSQEMSDSRDAFIKQFIGFNPVYRPHFYYHDIERSIQKEVDLSPNLRSDLICSLSQQIKRLKASRDIVVERLSTPVNVMEMKPELLMYFSQIAKELYFMETKVLQLNSGETANLSAEQLLPIVKAEWQSHAERFPLKAFFSLLKLFPLVRRREISKRAFDKLISDLDGSSYPRPSIPSTEEQLVNDLSRLASLLDLEFDIDAHDGHRFF